MYRRIIRCLDCRLLAPLNREGFCEDCAEAGGAWEPKDLEFVTTEWVDLHEQNNSVRNPED